MIIAEFSGNKRASSFAFPLFPIYLLYNEDFQAG